MTINKMMMAKAVMALTAMTLSSASTAAGQVTVAAQTYTISDLGPIYVSPYGHKIGACGLNNSGVVVGGAPVGSACHAVYWKPGSSIPTDLGAPGPNSYSLGANEYGEIVGRYGDPFNSGNTHAFVWDAVNGMRQLPSKPSNIYGTAGSINARGHRVGESGNYSGDPFTHAVLWVGSAVFDIGTLPGMNFSSATFNQGGTNSFGQVVGGSGNLGSSFKAFLWTPSTPNATSGTIINLGTLGGAQSNATVINSSGIVTGASQTASAAWHAFRWTPAAPNGSTGVMKDLGTLGGSSSSGQGINDAGETIGASQLSGNVISHPFLYANGTMRDLNSLLPSGSGWELLDAYAINNGGQIVGYGSVKGQLHSYVLSPPRPR